MSFSLPLAYSSIDMLCALMVFRTSRGKANLIAHGFGSGLLVRNQCKQELVAAVLWQRITFLPYFYHIFHAAIFVGTAPFSRSRHLTCTPAAYIKLESC